MAQATTSLTNNGNRRRTNREVRRTFRDVVERACREEMPGPGLVQRLGQFLAQTDSAHRRRLLRPILLSLLSADQNEAVFLAARSPQVWELIWKVGRANSNNGRTHLLGVWKIETPPENDDLRHVL